MCDTLTYTWLSAQALILHFYVSDLQPVRFSLCSEQAKVQTSEYSWLDLWQEQDNWRFSWASRPTVVAHSAFCVMGYEIMSSGSKAAGAWSWSLPLP